MLSMLIVMILNIVSLKPINNPHARWMVATRSPFTYGSYEYGDGYVNQILSNNPGLVSASSEWKDTYGN
mgnify:CR=1 FL=1